MLNYRDLVTIVLENNNLLIERIVKDLDETKKVVENQQKEIEKLKDLLSQQ